MKDIFQPKSSPVRQAGHVHTLDKNISRHEKEDYLLRPSDMNELKIVGNRMFTSWKDKKTEAALFSERHV